jgi:hypothetical protein
MLLPLGPISPLPATYTFLMDYDVIVVNTSGGKDSQTSLAVVAQFCKDLAILDRVVAVHADLGRMEWEGTKEIAKEQAAHWGVRFLTVSRIGDKATHNGKAYKSGETFGDLLDYVERRGKWPDNRNRYCTSDFKRGPVDKLHTKLAKEWKARRGLRRPCRILNVMGMRAPHPRVDGGSGVDAHQGERRALASLLRLGHEAPFLRLLHLRAREGPGDRRPRQPRAPP